MKKTAFRCLPAIILSLLSSATFAQEPISRVLAPGYDPNYDKIIPDKVFEIGLPLLVLFLLANAVVNVFKIRADSRLKEKALERQLSEPALIALFAQDQSLSRYSYVKWFLILAALGLSFILLQLIAGLTGLKSGYLAVGIICLLLSLAFLLYFNIIRRK